MLPAFSAAAWERVSGQMCAGILARKAIAHIPSTSLLPIFFDGYFCFCWFWSFALLTLMDVSIVHQNKLHYVRCKVGILRLPCLTAEFYRIEALRDVEYLSCRQRNVLPVCYARAAADYTISTAYRPAATARNFC